MTRVVLLVMAVLLARAAHAQPSDMAALDRAAIDRLMGSEHWPFRVFGLLRLERYEGDAVNAQLRAGLGDGVWQVRCFAIAQAHAMGIAIDPAAFTGESHPMVVRTLLRHGVRLDGEMVARGTRKLLESRRFEQMLLGIELAAATDDAGLRDRAGKRLAHFLSRVDHRILAMVGDRLVALLQPRPVPETPDHWMQWLRAQGGRISLPAASPAAVAPPPARRRSPIAELDTETFVRLIDYLDSLKQRDIELVIVMDATASMVPMINEARAGVDELIQFLNDISRSMRLGFVAYRDHDHENMPVVQAARLTSDVDSIRGYLFDLKITGGADMPEAVLDGFRACRSFEWNHRAARQLVLVGDAPPHKKDEPELGEVLRAARDAGVVVNAVHVPQRRGDAYYRHIPADAAAHDRAFLREYNTTTARTFRSIAELGGGSMTSLEHANELVPAIMRFSIEEGWWPVFDAFYAEYVRLCR